jgi:hypothetical protein
VSCTSPLLPRGLAVVEFSTDSKTFSANGLTLTLYPAPRVTALSPQGGFSGGGTVVTVYGNELFTPNKTADAKCRFGVIPTDAVAFFPKPGASVQALVCIAPVNIGSFPVEVSLNGGNVYTRDEVTFFYFQILQTNPPNGPSVGRRNELLLVGAGLDATLFKGVAGTCSFTPAGKTATAPGAKVVQVPLRYIDKQRIACPATVLPVGTYYAGFTVSNGVTAVGTGLPVYTSFLQTNFSSIEPVFGPASGGTSILMIPVEGFTQFQGISCKFGESIVTGIVSVNALGSILTCISPEGTGEVPMSVSLNDVDFIEVTRFQ